MAVRTLIDAVKGGEALIIFPEGRITVTGSLMKVYDGAAMIAYKANAEVVPVRIERDPAVDAMQVFAKLMGKAEAASRRAWMEQHGNTVEVDV